MFFVFNFPGTALAASPLGPANSPDTAMKQLTKLMKAAVGGDKPADALAVDGNGGGGSGGGGKGGGGGGGNGGGE